MAVTAKPMPACRVCGCRTVHRNGRVYCPCCVNENDPPADGSYRDLTDQLELSGMLFRSCLDAGLSLHGAIMQRLIVRLNTLNAQRDAIGPQAHV